MHTDVMSDSRYSTPPSKDEQFLENLDIAIEFHRTNKNDPHSIDPAVMTALIEVKACYKAALDGKRLEPKP